MLFKPAAASFLALLSFSSAASLKHKRTTESGLTLYGYGGEVDGAQIIYADGLAYLAKSGYPTGASVATNITFTVDPDDTSTQWTIQSNTTSFNETMAMYIVPTDGEFAQVGFTSNSSSTPTGAVTTGFSFFGTSVAYVTSNSEYELMFCAMNTTTTGVYALYWNAGSTDTPSGAFPIVIKSTAPVSRSH